MFNLQPEAEAEVSKMEEEAQAAAKQAEEEARAEAEKIAEEKRLAELKERFGTNKLIVLADQLPVHGLQLIPHKLLGIIEKAWELLETPAITAISFTTDSLIIQEEDKEEVLTGGFDALTKTAVISLKQLFEDATSDDVLGDMAVDAQVWAMLIQITLHEMAHYHFDKDEEADDKAKDIFTTIAQKWEIETPALIDMGWLGYKLDEFYADIEESDDPKHAKQRQLRMEDCVYKFESGKRLGSLRDWVRLYNVDRRSEDAWHDPAETIQQAVQVPAAQATVSQPTNAPVSTSTPVPGNQGELEASMAAYMAEMGAMDSGSGVATDTSGMPNPVPTQAPAQPMAQQGTTPQSSQAVKPWDAPSSIPPKAVTCGPDDLRTARREVLLSCFQAMFCNCGWDYQGGFADPEYVARTEINMNHIPFANEALVGLDTVINGRKQYDVPSEGVLRGFVGARAKLPQYSVHFNDGQAVNRFSIIPQNPNTSSDPAKEAASGAMIAWVTTIGGKWVAKMTCPSGQPADRNNILIELL